MTIKYNINEIFPSIQGEGIEIGRPVLFVRLAGCNRKCAFCDTKHERTNMSVTPDELRKIVESYKIPSLIITGGEPTLQDLRPLLDTLLDFRVSIETNGDNGKELRSLAKKPNLTTIAIAPKGKKVLEQPEYHRAGLPGETLRIFKLLHPLFSREEIENFLGAQARGSASIFYIMPVNGEKELDMQNNDETYSLASSLAWKFRHLDIRWGTQFHKLIGVQ